MVNRKHIANAPLISSECILSWDNPEHKILVEPTEFKKNFIQANKGEISELDFEWLVPKQFVEEASENDYIYKIDYTSQNTSLAILLSKDRVKVTSDDSYQTWDEFSTEVGRLGKTTSEIIKSSGITVNSLRLRYIDAFRKSLLNGKSPVDFISQDLGVVVSLPGRLDDILHGRKASSFFLDYLIQIDEITKLKVSLGEATVLDNEDAAIFDIAAETNDDSVSDNLLETANTLHNLTDEFFFRLIEPVSDRLE